MSSTGLEVFDKTLQTTNIWLNEIMEEIGPDRQRAYRVLNAVLHALRDRLPLDESAHLAAQLPLLVRGLYFHEWHPAGKPERIRSADEFLSRIEATLQNDVRPTAPGDAARAVFRVIGRHVDRGEVEQVRQALPEDVRRLWPEGTA